MQNQPLDWIIENPTRGTARLLSTVIDKTLPDTISEIVNEKFENEDMR